jgi:cobalamin biosynthesis protein CobT
VAWRKIAGENLPKQTAEIARDPDIDPANLATAVVMTASVALRGDFDDALYPYATALQSSLKEANEQAGQWFDTMQRGGWLARWQELQDAKQEYVFVRELLRDVFGVDEQNLPPEDPDEVQGGDSGSGDSDTSDKDGESANGGKVTIDYEDLLNAKAHDSETREHSTGYVKIDYSRWDSPGKYSPHTWETTKIGFPELIIQGNEAFSVACTDTAKLSNTIDDCNVENIVHAARMALQVMSRKLWSTNLKRGRLDTRKLAKLGTHDMKRQGQPEVFKLPGQRKTLDTAVSVLVDASGSMIGERKYDMAIAAAYGMLQVCNTLHVPVEIAAFTEYVNLYHFLIKSWDERRVSKDTFLSRSESVSKALRDNADGDSIMLAYHRLRQRKEKKRVLLVLSDGQPAAGRGDIYGYTKKVIKSIEAGKNVDIMGIGIVDDTVRNLYANHKVISTADAIPSGLIEVLKNCITN